MAANSEPTRPATDEQALAAAIERAKKRCRNPQEVVVEIEGAFHTFDIGMLSLITQEARLRAIVRVPDGRRAVVVEPQTCTVGEYCAALEEQVQQVLARVRARAAASGASQ